MSLDYDYRGCSEAAKEVIQNDEGTTQSIVFGLMFLDIGVIDDKSIDEIEWRSMFFKKLDWGWCSNKPTVPSRDEWRFFTGLRVNVITKKRNEWLKHQLRRMQEEVTREQDDQRKQQVAA